MLMLMHIVSKTRNLRTAVGLESQLCMHHRLADQHRTLERCCLFFVPHLSTASGPTASALAVRITTCVETSARTFLTVCMAAPKGAARQADTRLSFRAQAERLM